MSSVVPPPVWMITVWSRALAAGCKISGLADAPGNHSDQAKIEGKGGYIALEKGCTVEALGGIIWCPAITVHTGA